MKNPNLFPVSFFCRWIVVTVLFATVLCSPAQTPEKADSGAVAGSRPTDAGNPVPAILLDPVGEWTTVGREPEFSLCCWESGDARGEMGSKGETIQFWGSWKMIEEGKWAGHMLFSGKVVYWGIGDKDITPVNEKFEGLLEVAQNKLTLVKGLDVTSKTGRVFHASGPDGNNMLVLLRQNKNRPKILEEGN